jgi:hypothetical protein
MVYAAIEGNDVSLRLTCEDTEEMEETRSDLAAICITLAVATRTAFQILA